MTFAVRLNRKFSLSLALVILAVAVFANTIGHGWTMDDWGVIVRNPDVKSWTGFFADSYPGRPLRELTFLVDHSLFGMEPAGWHIQQIFWHSLCGVLLFLTARRLDFPLPVAWLGAALFLVHPLTVEAVANLSNRKESLAVAFSLLALLAFARSFRLGGRSWRWRTLSFALAGVAFVGKETAVVMPIVFAAYELVFVSPEQRFMLRRPWLAAAACGAGVGGFLWWLLDRGLAIYAEQLQPLLWKMNVLAIGDETLAIYPLMVLKSWSFMALRLFWPLDLAPEYIYAAPDHWLDPWVLSSVLLVLIIAGLAVWAAKRHPGLFVALSWMVLFYLPVFNLWPLAYFAADRYLYAPLAGFGLLAAAGLWRLCCSSLVPFWVTGLLAVCLLGTLSVAQNRVWCSNLVLWSHAVEVNPESTMVRYNLGASLLRNERPAEALPHFLAAAKNFNDSIPFYGLGMAYEALGKDKLAIKNYRTFLQFNDPRYPDQIREVRFNLARMSGRAE